MNEKWSSFTSRTTTNSNPEHGNLSYGYTLQEKLPQVKATSDELPA